MPREKAHPLFLVGIQSMIERRPRISELFEIGGSLSQGIGASTHEFNRINFAPLTELSCHRYHPVVSCLCPGADSFLNRGPKFFLLRCQLQRRLDAPNSRVGHGFEVGVARDRRGRLLRIGERGASNKEEGQYANYALQHWNLLSSF